jgi:hypothetical protein
MNLAAEIRTWRVESPTWWVLGHSGADGGTACSLKGLNLARDVGGAALARTTRGREG